MTTDLAERAKRAFAFGPFELIPERQVLLHAGNPIRLGGRALDMLTLLVSRAGELVSKRELLAHVWPDTVVEESNVKVNMVALRRALGDGQGNALYIATIAGRGYRFVATVRASGTVDLLGSSRAMDKRGHNLPTGIARIVGRWDAIEGIRGEIERSRLVSIVGAGGIGKTTVALAVAGRAVGSFPEGVWFVDLSLLEDSARMADAIASAIGATSPPAGSMGSLCDLLRGSEMLLVLDNCEHLIDEAASCVTRILSAAPGVRILVTSREPLLAKGERVRRLSPLLAPPSAALLNAEDAMSYPAVELFVACATDRLESYHLCDADATAVGEICRRLDGLPLAIELAATTIDASGVGGLLHQFDVASPLLASRRAGPARHRSLKATLDWSYDLLSQDETTLLRAASVFEGAFDIEGASAVSTMDLDMTGDILARLAAKSLVTMERTAKGVEYQLFHTMRVNCLERLTAGGEHEVHRRHAEHVCAVLERSTIEGISLGAVDWDAAHGCAMEDLRSALVWAGADLAAQPLLLRLAAAGTSAWKLF